MQPILNAALQALSAATIPGRTSPASNGNTYHSVDLGDRGGVFSCTVFGDSPVSEVLRAAGEGAVVRIEGKVEFYQGRFSPRLHRATPLDEDALAAPCVLESLVETAPEDAEAMWKEFNDCIDAIRHDELRGLSSPQKTDVEREPHSH